MTWLGFHRARLPALHVCQERWTLFCSPNFIPLPIYCSQAQNYCVLVRLPYALAACTSGVVLIQAVRQNTYLGRRKAPGNSTADIPRLLRVCCLCSFPPRCDHGQSSFPQQVCRGDPTACGHVVAFLRQLHELNHGQPSAGGGVRHNSRSSRRSVGDNCGRIRNTGSCAKSANNTHNVNGGRSVRNIRRGNTDQGNPRPASCKGPTSSRHTRNTDDFGARANIDRHVGHDGATRTDTEPAFAQNIFVPSRTTPKERFGPSQQQPAATTPPPPPPVPFPRSFAMRPRPRKKLAETKEGLASNDGKDEDRVGGVSTRNSSRQNPSPATAIAQTPTAVGAAAASLAAASRRRVATAAPVESRQRAAVTSNPVWDTSTTLERAVRSAGRLATEGRMSAAGAGQGGTPSSNNFGKSEEHFRRADGAVNPAVTSKAAGRVGSAGAAQKRADRREILRWMGRLRVKVTPEQ